MDFRIADTFTDSLARLTGEEQKLAKTTAFDLHLDPAGAGMQFHRLSKSKDPNFWSVRVGSDLRLIVHKTASSLMLCYVDHHDAAYRWAKRRKIERHPRTGTARNSWKCARRCGRSSCPDDTLFDVAERLPKSLPSGTPQFYKVIPETKYKRA